MRGVLGPRWRHFRERGLVRCLPFAFILGLTPSLLGAAEVSPTVTRLQETSCPREAGGERPIALVESVYAKPKAPDALFSYGVNVWSIEAPEDISSDRPRIWQFETGSMEGAHPAANWAGTVICGREADRAYFLLVITHGTGVIAEVYPVDLSATEPDRLPRAETLKNVSLAGRDAPEPLISILAQTDTCQLDTLSAVWEKEQLILSMSHGAEACKVFKLAFDPKKVEFTSIPKDWTGVKTSLGKRSYF
jgi:hypothetical protein